MSRFLTFRLETKMTCMAPNPLTKEESRRVYKCDDERLSGRLNTGFSKVCEIFKVCGRESI